MQIISKYNTRVRLRCLEMSLSSTIFPAVYISLLWTYQNCWKFQFLGIVCVVLSDGSGSESVKCWGRIEKWGGKRQDVIRRSRLIDAFPIRDISSAVNHRSLHIIITDKWLKTILRHRHISHTLHKLELIDVKFPGCIVVVMEFAWSKCRECNMFSDWKWVLKMIDAILCSSADCIWQWTTIIENTVRYFKSKLDRAHWFSSRQPSSYGACSNMKENIQNMFYHRLGFISIRSIKLNVVYYSCEYWRHFNIILDTATTVR